jgi:hypothetical protein
MVGVVGSSPIAPTKIGRKIKHLAHPMRWAFCFVGNRWAIRGSRLGPLAASTPPVGIAASTVKMWLPPGSTAVDVDADHPTPRHLPFLNWQSCTPNQTTTSIMRSLLISVLLASWTALAAAGPFGLEMGMTLEQLRRLGVNLKPAGDNWYTASKMPKSLDSFESFQLWIEPGIGLCKMTAIGRTINWDSNGNKIRSEFNDTEELLLTA